MSEEKFLELSIKFLGDELKGAELEEFQEYLKDDQYIKKFDVILARWNNATESLETIDFDTREGFKNFIEKIESKNTKQYYQSSKAKYYDFFKKQTFVRIAASIAFILVVSTILFNYTSIFDNKEVIEKWHEKVTKLGEKSTLTFLDGTRIVLNAGSKLKYPVSLDDSVRKVYLEGEAYFEVSRNQSKPFVVYAGKVSTFVLGTKFDVKAYPEEDEISVSLIEGKVKVSNKMDGVNGQGIILKPQEQVLVNKITGDESISLFDQVQITGWKDNNLKFDDEKLSEVIVKIERAYGIKMELADDSLANFKITADFVRDSFWTTIKVIAAIEKLKYKTIDKNGELKKIVFYK
ncbi:MAG: FecR domain-containing protein [Ignavibacteria bacterium]|jgi:ferric-dicitrate binding protein FerR (iron transport regulator)